MSKFFVLVGDHVRSVGDRDRHYVGPRQLLELYRLDPAECVFCVDIQEVNVRLVGVDQSSLTFLYPRRRGDYEQVRAKVFTDLGRPA